MHCCCFLFPLESLFLNIYQYTNDFSCWNSLEFPFKPISFCLFVCFFMELSDHFSASLFFF